jgi:hypothetical protein
MNRTNNVFGLLLLFTKEQESRIVLIDGHPLKTLFLIIPISQMPF